MWQQVSNTLEGFPCMSTHQYMDRHVKAPCAAEHDVWSAGQLQGISRVQTRLIIVLAAALVPTHLLALLAEHFQHARLVCLVESDIAEAVKQARLEVWHHAGWVTAKRQDLKQRGIRHEVEPGRWQDGWQQTTGTA
jgi:hypothetical protein